MTREEFTNKFRGRMLLLMTEAWAVRKESPSALGIVMDAHAVEIKRLLMEMYEALSPHAKNTVPLNGTAQKRGA